MATETDAAPESGGESGEATGAAEKPWLKMYPEGIDWQAQLEIAPLWKNLDGAVARYPNHNLLDFLDRKFTYSQIGDLSNRAAKGFQDIGVGKGVNVGLFLPNCPQFVICYYGILKAGGTVVNYSPLYSEPELEYQIEDSHTDIMVTLNVEALYPKMAGLLPKTRHRKLVIGTIAEVLPFPKSLLYPLVKRKEISKVPNDDRHVRFAALTTNGGDFAPVAAGRVGGAGLRPGGGPVAQMRRDGQGREMLERTRQQARLLCLEKIFSERHVDLVQGVRRGQGVRPRAAGRALQ